MSLEQTLEAGFSQNCVSLEAGTPCCVLPRVVTAEKPDHRVFAARTQTIDPFIKTGSDFLWFTPQCQMERFCHTTNDDVPLSCWSKATLTRWGRTK